MVAADESSLFWVPMFAINDWESTTKVFRSVCDQSLNDDCKRIVALNNRADRTDRAQMFVDLVSTDIKGEFDRIVLYGDIQDVIRKQLVTNGVDDSVIYSSDDVDETDGGALLDRACEGYGKQDVAIFGMVNIHTEGVTAMRRHVDAMHEGSLARSIEQSVPTAEKQHNSASEDQEVRV